MSQQLLAGPARRSLSVGKRPRLPAPTEITPPTVKPIPKWVEWLSCFTGLLGSAVLALKGEYAGWGFVAYLVSNLGWIAYGVATRTWAIVLMQLGFTVTSVIGIKNYLLP